MPRIVSKYPGVIIAGTHSGVGKSSITVGLMRALQSRGLNVKPFKVGAGLHRSPAPRPGRRQTQL